ncbi:hypothetical protein N0V92_003374 [Colletotrichum tropicale]|nr:hypothetical protein N0V92_003374 [Colletotrichum tropicale]
MAHGPPDKQTTSPLVVLSTTNLVPQHHAEHDTAIKTVSSDNCVLLKDMKLTTSQGTSRASLDESIASHLSGKQSGPHPAGMGTINPVSQHHAKDDNLTSSNKLGASADGGVAHDLIDKQSDSQPTGPIPLVVQYQRGPDNATMFVGSDANVSVHRLGDTQDNIAVSTRPDITDPVDRGASDKDGEHDQPGILASSDQVMSLRGGAGGKGKKKKKDSSDSEADFNPASAAPQAMPSGRSVSQAQKVGGRRMMTRRQAALEAKAAAASANNPADDGPTNAGADPADNGSTGHGPTGTNPGDTDPGDTNPEDTNPDDNASFDKVALDPITPRTTASGTARSTKHVRQPGSGSDGSDDLYLPPTAPGTAKHPQQLDSSPSLPPIVPRPTKHARQPGSSSEASDGMPPPLSSSKPDTKRQKASSIIPGRGPDKVPSNFGARLKAKGLSVLDERNSEPTGQIWNNYERYNQARIKTALDNMKLEQSKALVTTVKSTTKKSLDTLLSLPQVRNFSVKIGEFRSEVRTRAPSRAYWTLLAVDPSSSEIRIFMRVLQTEYTKDESVKICALLIDILNRWDLSLDLLVQNTSRYRVTSHTVRILFMSCRMRLFPEKRIRCELPKFYYAKPGGYSNTDRQNRFEYIAFALDPTTFLHWKDHRIITPDMAESADPPELSEHFEFVHYDNHAQVSQVVAKVPAGPGQDPTFKSMIPSQDDYDIPDDERQNLAKAEKIARLHSAFVTVQGCIFDKTEGRQMWHNTVEKYGGKVKRHDTAGTGLFAGSFLYQVQTHATQTSQVRASRKVENALKEIDSTYRLPGITIVSPHRAWVLPVEQALIDTWILEGDLRTAWTRAAEVADEVNLSIRDGDKPPSMCSCSDEDRLSITHPCAQCGRPILCKDLQASQHDGHRVCNTCELKRVHRYSGAGTVLPFLVRVARDTLDADRKRGDAISDEEFYQTMDGIRVFLLENLPSAAEVDDAEMPPGVTWKDRYSGKLYSMPNERSYSSRSVPDKPSLDATFPMWPTSYGYRLHTPENLSITSQAINFAKHIHVPALLHHLSWFTERRDKIIAEAEEQLHAPKTRARLAELETKMMKFCRRLRGVRLLFAWKAKTRMNSKISRKEFLHNLNLGIAGKVPPSAQAALDKTDQKYVHLSPSGRIVSGLRWPEKELARIRALAEEITAFFGVTLPSKGGCPFFGHASAMPSNWGWSAAFALMAERHTRMTYYCNKHHPTYDTPDTIYLESIFQVCVFLCSLNPTDPNHDIKARLKAKYATILGLPMGVAVHDPLTMAVAHRVHHRGMYSGWCQNARTLKQRLDADDENNMSIEARTENFLKSDYNEADYPKLKDMILAVRLPKEVYDPSIDISSEEYGGDFEDFEWTDDLDLRNDEDLYDVGGFALSDTGDSSESSQRSKDEEVAELPELPELPKKSKQPAKQPEDDDDDDVYLWRTRGKARAKRVLLDDDDEDEDSGGEALQSSKSIPRETSVIVIESDPVESHPIEPEPAQLSVKEMADINAAKLNEVKDMAEVHPSKPTSDPAFRKLIKGLEKSMEEGDQEAFDNMLAYVWMELAPK